MTTLSIAIDDELAKAIEELAMRLGKRKEDLIASALEQQMSLMRSATRSRMTLEEFEEVRARLRPYAEAAGYTREEEILDDIS